MVKEQSIMKIYKEDDANLEILKGKKLAIIGYGSQGSAQANCIRDSGLNIIIGLRKGKSWDKALKDKHRVFSVEEAAEKGDIILLLIPDEKQEEAYKNQIERFLTKGKTLAFAHGFSIVFNAIIPPKDIDVIMVSPRAPGILERKLFLEGSGVPCSIAVKQDFSGNARQTALALAKSCGFTRIGAMETTFENETFGDLFGEQVVLCGGVSELIKKAFETLVESGQSKEMAYLDCLHELKLLVDLINQHGIEGMYSLVSNTAEFGSRKTGVKIIDEHVKENMKKALEEIKNGNFAKEWIKDAKNGMAKLNELREEQSKHEIEWVGKRVRGWVFSNIP